MASLLWHTETDAPVAWAEWRAAIERFNLGDEVKLTSWIDVIDTFIKLGLSSPSKLALISSTQLRVALEGHHLRNAATQIWTDAALLMAYLSPAAFLVLKGSSGNAEKLPRRLNNSTLCNTAARSDVKQAANLSKIHKPPKDFDKLGTAAKLNTMRNAQIP